MDMITKGGLATKEVESEIEGKRNDIIKYLIDLLTGTEEEMSEIKWGDELESLLLYFDHDRKRVYAHNNIHELLARLAPVNNLVIFTTEGTPFQIESNPEKPYSDNLSELIEIYHNLKQRRAMIEDVLKPSEAVSSIGNFPLCGAPDFFWPPLVPTPESGIAPSFFFPDAFITKTMSARNERVYEALRKQKGRNPSAHIPIFKDIKTQSPFKDPCGDPQAKIDHVYLYTSALGGGYNSLQVTIGCRNLDEARQLYDQLAVFSPILLALTAGEPIHRGFLCDVDSRWGIIAAMMDGRSKDEEKFKRAQWSCIDAYLNHGELNDLPTHYDKECYIRLVEAGVDPLLARHFAYLITLPPHEIEVPGVSKREAAETHLNSLLSVQWDNVRLKWPVRESDLGWRVEFRPMSVQLTDWENAAFASLVILLAKLGTRLGYDFSLPISLVNENMDRAQKRNSVLDQKFYFSKNFLAKDRTEVVAVELTLDEIFNGTDDFEGLSTLILADVSRCSVDLDVIAQIESYLELIKKRATGELLTLAGWQRRFVQNHPSYKHDSVVSQDTVYDMMVECLAITKGKECPELLGRVNLNR